MDDTAAIGSPAPPRAAPPERAIARLLALSRAALHIQEALTPDAVLEAVGAELRALGMHWLYAALEPGEQTVTVRAISIAPTLLSAIERLLGQRALGFPIAVDRVAVLRAAVRERRAGIAAGLDAMRETLPSLPAPLLRQLLRTAGLGSLIVAPLVARGRTLGVLAVWADDLAADDVPAMVAFAQQAATAHDNARLLQEARTERARMAEFFAQAPAAVAMFLGAEHVVAFANPLYLRMVGHADPGPVLGKPAREALPAPVAPGYVALLDRVYASGLPFVGSELPASFAGRGDGAPEDGLYNLVLQPYRDAGGAVEGILLHAVEVTEQVRARREAEAAVRERDEFLSIAAHELKTPVTGLRGFTQVLLRRLDRTGVLEPATASGMLRQINRQAGKLAQLVNQLLDLSRLEAGRLTIEPQPIELRQVVEEAIAAVRAQTERRTITLDAPPAVAARLDPLRIEQALINLLDNADRYSPRDRPIDVALAVAPQALHLSVRDHGGGIPPDRREHIFDRFYRAHTASHTSGMGLGLYLSRQIAELHGGALTVEFPPDGGARFVLALPRSDEG